MNINPAFRGKLTVVARGEVSSPALSADGNVVVYNEFKNSETAVYRHEDGETVKLTNDGHASMHADLNADGSKVVFSRFSDGNLNDPGSWDIALWDEATGKTSIVSASIGNEGSPEISDNGRVIVWEDDVDGKLGNNDILKAVDGKVEHVTKGRNLDISPKISGDGERIVWRRFNSGVSEFLIQDQNDVVKPYISNKDSVIGGSLTYDGQQMVYADKTAGDEDMMHYDDQTSVRSTVAGVKNVKETWGSISGDGGTVAWTGMDFRKGAPADTNVYMRRDDENLQVTTAQGGRHSAPVLSHDGKTMVWTWADQDDIKNRVIYKLEME